MTSEPVAIEPGTYGIPNSGWSALDYTVTIPKGWTVVSGQVFQKHGDAPDNMRLHAFRPDTIYADTCAGSQGERLTVGPSVADLAAALGQQRGPKATVPVDTTLAGHPATMIHLSVPKGFDLKACNLEGVGLQVWFSHPADGYVVLVPDTTATVYITEVDGQRQVFVTEHGSATSSEDLTELQRVLDSIAVGA